MLTVISYRIATDVGQQLGTPTQLPGGPGYIPKEWTDKDILAWIQKLTPRSMNLNAQIKTLEAEWQKLPTNDPRRTYLYRHLRDLRRQQYMMNRQNRR